MAHLPLRWWVKHVLWSLVVENLDVDILGGIPFMEKNDLTTRPAKRQTILGNGTVYLYGSETTCHSHWSHVSMLPTYNMRSHIGFGPHLECRWEDPHPKPDQCTERPEEERTVLSNPSCYRCFTDR